MAGPTLGDFRGPSQNPERVVAAEAAAAPAPTPVAAAEPPVDAKPKATNLTDAERTALEGAQKLFDEVLAGGTEDPMTAVFGAFDQISGAFSPKTSSVDRYKRRLKLADVSEAQAMAVVDAVLSKGYYEEYVFLLGKRATFRTRVYEDSLRLQTDLERNAHLQLRISQSELISRHNLAASLYEWRGEPVSHEGKNAEERDAAFNKIMDWIARMPTPVVQMLYESLAKFDQRISVIFSEGCTDIFSNPVG